MAVQSVIQTGNINAWVEGTPSTELKITNSKTNDFSFWVEGIPYAPCYPGGNNGGFFMFFPV